MLGLIVASPIGRAIGALIIIATAILGFHIWLETHDAAIAARARMGYVLEAERITAEQTAKELRRQLEAAEASLTSFRNRQAEDASRDAQREKDRANEILAYELRLSQANRSCLLDRSDLEFLQRN